VILPITITEAEVVQALIALANGRLPGVPLSEDESALAEILGTLYARGTQCIACRDLSDDQRSALERARQLTLGF
jgi:hypothetical protein